MPGVKWSEMPILTALAGTDRVPLYDVSGPENATITVDNLRKALEPTSLYLPCNVLTPFGPSRAPEAVAFSDFLSFDQAGQEFVAGHARIPDSWTTYDVTARMLNPVASSGNVRVQVNICTITAGSAISPSNGTVTTVAASSTQWRPFEATFRTGVTIGADRRVGITFLRIAADAADTLPNDLGLIDITLTKAS